MAKGLASQTTIASDTELVRHCQDSIQQNDPEQIRICFQQLYQRFHQRVRATLYQLCGAALLDDLVQEVFLKVWKGLPKLREAKYFSTWLYRISWNVATDQRRAWAKSPPETSVDLGRSLNEEEHPLKDYLSRPQDSPDMMQLYYQELVQQSLAQLSLDHRAVIVLHDLEDLPQKEVAQILELPIGTVKSRLFHARRSVRDYLVHQGVTL